MKPLKILGWGVGGLIGAVALIVAGFFLTAWVGSSIPRNSGWSEAETGIPIMVETNGVHTGIVMPIATPVKDWRETFPSAAEPMAGGMRPTRAGATGKTAAAKNSTGSARNRTRGGRTACTSQKGWTRWT